MLELLTDPAAWASFLLLGLDGEVQQQARVAFALPHGRAEEEVGTDLSQLVADGAHEPGIRSDVVIQHDAWLPVDG